MSRVKNKISSSKASSRLSADAQNPEVIEPSEILVREDSIEDNINEESEDLLSLDRLENQLEVELDFENNLDKLKDHVVIVDDKLEVLPSTEALVPIDDYSIYDDEKKDDKLTKKTELVPYDSLQAYLSEISRHPILSREDEHQLAVNFKKFGDQEAAYKLVLGNLRLVVMIAREYQRAVRSILDLIQEGNIGLIEAVKKYDPYRGIRFPSYAVWWIRAYIVRYVIANWRLVKIGTTQAQRKLFFNLRKEQEKLERAGFYPGPKLLAEKLDVKESEVLEMQQRLESPDLSVDTPLDDDPDSSLLSFLSDGSDSAEDTVGKNQMRKLILDSFNEFSSELNHKEQVIFEKRLLGEEKATLEDLGLELKISRERVRQIENRLKEKLKQFLIGKFGADFFVSAFEI